jgi:hypothetical protein
MLVKVSPIAKKIWAIDATNPTTCVGLDEINGTEHAGQETR